MHPRPPSASPPSCCRRTLRPRGPAPTPTVPQPRSWGCWCWRAAPRRSWSASVRGGVCEEGKGVSGQDPVSEGGLGLYALSLSCRFFPHQIKWGGCPMGHKWCRGERWPWKGWSTDGGGTVARRPGTDVPPHPTPCSVLQCVPCGSSVPVLRVTTGPRSLCLRLDHSQALLPCEY